MNDELGFDAVLLKKVTDAYTAKFPVLPGQACNEIVDEVVRLIEAPCTGHSWTPATSPPSDNKTVLLALSDGDVWQGYYAGGVWRDVTGLPLDTIRVTRWAPTPAHPDLTMTVTQAKPAEAIESWHTGLPLPDEKDGTK